MCWTAKGIGVNWGTTASHPLPPPKAVELLKTNNISKVKLFDADPLVLQALSGSNIGVTVGIPNSMLKTLNSSKKAADSWVHDNVTRYFSAGTTGVRIQYVAVGDEPFHQSYGEQFHPFVIGTAINIQSALTRASLAGQIKVVIPCSYDTFHFDLSYDTLATALSMVGFPDMNIVISKIGWPTDGAANATSPLAETFMKGLMYHLRSRLGTPLRPQNPPIETYIFSLLDENQRSIATGNFERHWGVFTFDGQAKYHIDFGQGLKNPMNAQNVEYLPSKWCVVNNNQDLSNATASALDACSVADCTALSPGGSCFNISWPGNISYAFNSYYQQHDQRAESCDFGGLGLVTTIDPSVGNCRFPIEIKASHAHSLSGTDLFQWMVLLLLNAYFFLLHFT
ncbi:Glucan endo-1,3-beta-glucosidase, acidic isoform PR-O, putative [Ricinus communis]|uniref:glucan endo-1,3-beta-D-glucosidase n=1 Tax=Ricinus communis TaxID=3988 RepID=B9RPN4_RICCO|nr:Glucan endo-1,3-beta-glucosidase, acidic isoform PR-O, putative [Ricinus communis]